MIPVVADPDFELSTETARGTAARPPCRTPGRGRELRPRGAADPCADAGSPELLAAGTADYLHQDYRAAGHADQRGADRGAARGGLAAFISGAGPTVMALANGAAEADALVEFIAARTSRDNSGGITAACRGVC